MVRNALFRPAVEDLVDTEGFRAAKLFVAQVGVVNHFRDALYATVANRELLVQSLEGAIFSAVSKTLRAEHVEWDGIGMSRGISGEEEAGFRIDEAANQPGRRNTVDAGARTSHPDALEIGGRLHFAGGIRRGRRLQPGESGFDSSAQRRLEEVDLQGLCEAAAKAQDLRCGPLVRRKRTQFVQFTLKLAIVAGTGIDEELPQARRGQVIEGLYLHDRSLPFVAANGGGEPLHTFEICGRVGEQVSGTGERERAVFLQLAPDLDALAGQAGGQGEDQQEPWRFLLFWYRHCMMLYT